MAFPDNVLARDEKVELSLHPHWMTVIAPIFLGFLLVFTGALVAKVTPATSGWDIVQWVVIGLLVLLAIVFVFFPILRWRTTHYVITSHRVMVRRGILSKTGKDITLGKITDVSFHQTFLDRIIRAGSLRIESAGEGPDEALSNIPNSQRVQQLINRLVDEDDLRRRQAGAAPGAGYERHGYADRYGYADQQGQAPRGNDRGYADERGYAGERGYADPGRGERGFDERGYDERGYDERGYTDERSHDTQPYGQGGYDGPQADPRGGRY